MTPKEALEEIQGTTETDWGFGFGGDDRYPMEYNLFDDDERFNIIYQALTELEELKQRDTPMKLTQASRFTTDKKLYGMYVCNSCHEVIPYITLNSKRVKPKFCYHCGQRLDWSDGK